MFNPSLVWKKKTNSRKTLFTMMNNTCLINKSAIPKSRVHHVLIERRRDCDWLKLKLFFRECVTLDNDKPAYWQNVLEWKKQITHLSGCFRCAAWVGVNAGDLMQEYYIKYIRTSQRRTGLHCAVTALTIKPVWSRPNMKEPLTAKDGYQVINLQDEHTLRHKHCISMLNAIMNEVVSSSYLYLVTVCSQKRCTFVVNGMFNDASYWRSFFVLIFISIWFLVDSTKRIWIARWSLYKWKPPASYVNRGV